MTKTEAGRNVRTSDIDIDMQPTEKNKNKRRFESRGGDRCRCHPRCGRSRPSVSYSERLLAPYL